MHVANGKLRARKVIFEAEPKDYEILEFDSKEYGQLQFDPAVEAVAKKINKCKTDVARGKAPVVEKGVVTKSQTRPLAARWTLVLKKRNLREF